MSYHSDHSEKMGKPDKHTHAHVAEQDEVDIAAKLAVTADSDAPLSPENALRLRLVNPASSAYEMPTTTPTDGKLTCILCH